MGFVAISDVDLVTGAASQTECVILSIVAHIIIERYLDFLVIFLIFTYT